MKKTRKVYYLYQGKQFIPFIKISGKYLKSYDLNIGDSIELTLSKGEIVIHKLNNNQQERSKEL